ncbi:hypothetical protein [Gordonia polyisoprenivorans]|uniref:hypothetical protein n=1 Tax=Gordonia polyisoprenivorans TaxID=84595 RepID=UPI0022FFF2D4|nr:hypothetical protein [Gordonia polyisoprenivorans]WCB36112.1 hypothetical protein PHA63_18780 [Gordonia polyisoprenivorans]
MPGGALIGPPDRRKTPRPRGRERAGAEIGRAAVLLMATLFAAIIRPAAREIYASRAQAVREAGRAGARGAVSC